MTFLEAEVVLQGRKITESSAERLYEITDPVLSAFHGAAILCGIRFYL